MSIKPYNISIIVGRFQPFHNGHKNLIKKALELGDNVFIFIGYSGFTDMRHFIRWETVRNTILEEFKEYNDNLFIFPLQDMADDRKWVLKLVNKMNNSCLVECVKKDTICFVGAKKDMVWYANLLPRWDIMLLPDNGINATEIRKQFFCGEYDCNSVPEITNKMLNHYKTNNTEEYKSLREKFIDYYSIC